MRFDNEQARKEGWWVHPIDSVIYAFKPDSWALATTKESDEARAFVQRRANEGSAYHIEALAYVAFTEPPPMDPLPDWLKTPQLIPPNFPKNFTTP